VLVTEFDVRQQGPRTRRLILSVAGGALIAVAVAVAWWFFFNRNLPKPDSLQGLFSSVMFGLVALPLGGLGVYWLLDRRAKAREQTPTP
jgi:hypothetical protein